MNTFSLWSDDAVSGELVQEISAAPSAKRGHMRNHLGPGRRAMMSRHDKTQLRGVLSHVKPGQCGNRDDQIGAKRGIGQTHSQDIPLQIGPVREQADAHDRQGLRTSSHVVNQARFPCEGLVTRLLPRGFLSSTSDNAHPPPAHLQVITSPNKRTSDNAHPPPAHLQVITSPNKRFEDLERTKGGRRGWFGRRGLKDPPLTGVGSSDAFGLKIRFQKRLSSPVYSTWIRTIVPTVRNRWQNNSTVVDIQGKELLPVPQSGFFRGWRVFLLLRLLGGRRSCDAPELLVVPEVLSVVQRLGQFHVERLREEGGQH
uniref:Uncharacterized protein n=1 Tax=Timema bartmani TaxID=61472 RepID=A0A7R9F4W6_9NEOP|nr:unnamed protein product [Timema bartmani]